MEAGRYVAGVAAGGATAGGVTGVACGAARGVADVVAGVDAGGGCDSCDSCDSCDGGVCCSMRMDVGSAAIELESSLYMCGDNVAGGASSFTTVD